MKYNSILVTLKLELLQAKFKLAGPFSSGITVEVFGLFDLLDLLSFLSLLSSFLDLLVCVFYLFGHYNLLAIFGLAVIVPPYDIFVVRLAFRSLGQRVRSFFVVGVIGCFARHPTQSIEIDFLHEEESEL